MMKKNSSSDFFSLAKSLNKEKNETMQIKYIMSRNLITIQPHEPLSKASNMMKSEGIRHLPVIDEHGFLLGMLSDRDIKLASVTIKNDGQKSEHYIYGHSKVQEFMTSPVHKVKESDSIEKITRDMLESKVSCFVVEDEQEKTIGIITTEDLLIFLLDVLGQEKSVLSKLLSAFKIS